MDEVREESKTEPKWLSGFKEAEASKHRMVRAVEGKKKFHVECRRGVKNECRRTRHSWTDKFVGGHHLQPVVDVGRVRSLIW